MNSPIVISIGAGLVSAVLFLSTATGSLLAMLLFFVTALPGFIAGLGWGTQAALMTGVVAAINVGVVAGPASGAAYLASLGLPIALLVYLALLTRPSGADADVTEWYPVERLVVWATLLAGCVVALSVPILGFDAEAYRNTAKGYFDTTIFSNWPADAPTGLDREKLDALIDMLVLLLPAGTAMVWLGIVLTNMWAGCRIVAASGRAIRPCPTISEMRYPNQFPLGFVGALMATFLPGIAGIVATGFAGAFLLAYVIMGLVVLHVLVRRSAFPNFLLAVLYAAMLFSGWIAVLVAIVGLGEPIFKLRERASTGPRPPGNPGG